MKNHYVSPSDEYSISPARDATEVNQYLRIVKAEFTRNPRFGTFIASPPFLRMMRKDILAALEAGKRPLWIIRRGTEMLGGIESAHMAPDLDGRRRVSLGINLSTAAQGKGLARVLYAKIFEELIREKVEVFRGGTAQPGVMRLGKRMGRRLVGVHLQSGGTELFSRDHFRSWIEE